MGAVFIYSVIVVGLVVDMIFALEKIQIEGTVNPYPLSDKAGEVSEFNDVAFDFLIFHIFFYIRTKYDLLSA